MSTATRSYLRLLRALAARGLEKRAAETPLEYYRRIAPRLDGHAAAVARVTALYHAARFSGRPGSSEALDRAVEEAVIFAGGAGADGGSPVNRRRARARQARRSPGSTCAARVTGSSHATCAPASARSISSSSRRGTLVFVEVRVARRHALRYAARIGRPRASASRSRVWRPTSCLGAGSTTAARALMSSPSNGRMARRDRARRERLRGPGVDAGHPRDSRTPRILPRPSSPRWATAPRSSTALLAADEAAPAADPRGRAPTRGALQGLAGDRQDRTTPPSARRRSRR